MTKIVVAAFVFLFALSCSLFAGSDMDRKKYLGAFKTKRIHCFANVNDIYMIDNVEIRSGNASAGFNATAWLENGRNTISVLGASIGALENNLKLEKDSSCSLELSEDYPDSSTQVVSVILTADENLEATGKVNTDYDGAQSGQVITEGQVHESLLYQVKRNFTVSGLPEWKWTKATPLEPTPDNIERVRQAYYNLWTLMDRKDLDGLRQAMQIGIQEKAIAEGVSEDYIFDSLDLKGGFEESSRAHPIDWSLYELKLYMGGRIFRLDDGKGNTPLRMKYKDDESTRWSYNPYMSLINGKIVIVR